MILKWQDSWAMEGLNRRGIDANRICTFGIKPLDDALIGFLPDDLVVIAADSGAGKSHTAIEVAIHNAINGRNVALYSIEGNDEAAISRIKWKAMRNMYYNAKRTDIAWDFRKWRMNIDKNPALIKLEEQAMELLNQKIGKRLHLYHVNESFTLTDFKNSLGWFRKQKPGEFMMENVLDIDLLIIDHLQYFTFDTPGNELGETTEILRELKRIAEVQKIPVLLISHLRKKEKNRGLPNQEDLFGTSNTAKICSQCIVMASCAKGTDYFNDIYPTFFRFVKSRTGLKSNFAIISNFMAKTGTYDEQYRLIYLHENQPKEEFKPHQLPLWAYKPPVQPKEDKPKKAEETQVHEEDIKWAD